MTNYNESSEDREGSGGAAPGRAESGENPAEFGAGAGGPRPSDADLFLSPHSDDVCFSLGDLAARRGAGTLLTVYSRSRHIAGPAAKAASVDEVTARRLAEDAAFAAACNLAVEDLELSEAPLRGHRPFELDGLAREVETLEPLLLDRIRGLAARRKPPDRPWLFCPAGIGGHLDHAAIMTAIARNLDKLQAIYWVCFYEELPYASSVLTRSIGLRRLAQTLPQFTLTRRHWEMTDDGKRKLDLVRLYASQFAAPPAHIAPFSPALYLAHAPHESVWTVQRRS